MLPLIISDLQTASKGPKWPQKLHVPAQPHSASRVRAFVRNQAAAAGFADDDIAEIEVAVGEAVTNAILYSRPSAATAEKDVQIEVGMKAAILYIEVWDPGPGFDPGEVREVGPENGDATGGRGLYLMRVLMHRVDIRRDERGMRVRLERSLTASL